MWLLIFYVGMLLRRGNTEFYMRVDIGNALANVAVPGITRDNLDRLDEFVYSGHRRIQTGIDDQEPGYTALNLPESINLPEIYDAVEEFDDVDTVVICGIGGSALGAATLVDALADTADVRILDNIDPAQINQLLAQIDLDRTLVHVVSRSGRTAETIANFLVIRSAMDSAGVPWEDRVLFTTGEEGPLATIADRYSITTIQTPPNVPGRYSVLSSVALPTAAIVGVDIEELIRGGKAGRDRLTGSLYECPAYAYGAISYALAERGWYVNAMMPYAEQLETFAEWFAQLWAESLGKDGMGQVPVRALGATDQHSQLQLYRGGRRSTMLTLLRPLDRPTRSIPPFGLDDVSYLEGKELGALLDAEYRATEAALAAARRPTIRIEIDQIDAYSIGELLVNMQAACILAAELMGINAFNQPAVEFGKHMARRFLREPNWQPDEIESLVVK